MALWLNISLPFVQFPCNCSKCSGVDIPMEEDEPESLSEKQIADQSIKLRDSKDISSEAILHRAKQIIYGQFGTDARLAMNYIVENDLTGLKEFLDGLIGEREKFDREMLLEIAEVCDLPDNQILAAAQIIRKYHGADSIEPNFKQYLKEHGKEAEDHFEYIQLTFDIHYKDKKTKVTKTVEEKRYVVICKNKEEWLKKVKKERGIDDDEDVTLKVICQRHRACISGVTSWSY